MNRNEPVLRRIVDDRFVRNSKDGSTSGKEAYLKDILELRMLGQSLRERSVLIEGNFALVFGTNDIRLAEEAGGEQLVSVRYTTAYVNRNGQWRLIALQIQPRSEG